MVLQFIEASYGNFADILPLSFKHGPKWQTGFSRASSSRKYDVVPDRATLRPEIANFTCIFLAQLMEMMPVFQCGLTFEYAPIGYYTKSYEVVGMTAYTKNEPEMG